MGELGFRGPLSNELSVLPVILHVLLLCFMESLFVPTGTAKHAQDWRPPLSVMLRRTLGELVEELGQPLLRRYMQPATFDTILAERASTLSLACPHRICLATQHSIQRSVLSCLSRIGKPYPANLSRTICGLPLLHDQENPKFNVQP